MVVLAEWSQEASCQTPVFRGLSSDLAILEMGNLLVEAPPLLALEEGVLLAALRVSTAQGELEEVVLCLLELLQEEQIRQNAAEFDLGLVGSLLR